MISFSEALRRGELQTDRADDVFVTAYIGTLAAKDVAPFQQLRRASSVESFKDFLLRALMNAFAWQERPGTVVPGVLGRDVRAWPRLARDLEQMKMLTEAKRWQTRYRQEIHRSLWSVVAELYDCRDYSRADIAEFLEEYGL